MSLLHFPNPCYNDGMNEKALQTLEFHKIINRLTEHATSEPGRKKCQSLKPMTDLEQIEQAQLETKDALERILLFNSTMAAGSINRVEPVAD